MDNVARIARARSLSFIVLTLFLALFFVVRNYELVGSAPLQSPMRVEHMLEVSLKEAQWSVHAARLTLGLPVDINLIGPEDLVLLPGIGAATAESIIQKRIELKGFRSEEDLLLVKGIGTVRLAAIQGYIYINESGKLL